MDEEKLLRAMNDIDATIEAFFKERQWEQYVPEGGNDLFISFCRHLMFVITKFLELEDDKSRELMIQIPIEELANLDDNGGDSLQIQRWIDVATAIISCLSLATSKELKRLADVTKPYADGDTFLCLHGNQNAVGACEYLARDGSFRELNGSRVEYFDISICKVKCNRVIAKIISGGQIKRKKLEAIKIGDFGLIHISDYLSTLADHSMKTTYNSAALISLGSSGGASLRPKGDYVPWATDYLIPTVNFFNNPEDVTGANDKYEIIVVMGDRKYVDMPQLYRNTKAKKIIYIGTDAVERVEKYAFTFREMYRYCLSTHCSDFASSFHRPKTITLKFEWLEKRKQELEELLVCCGEKEEALTEQIQKGVMRKILSRFTNADFSSERLKELKQDWDGEKISEILGQIDSPATVDSIYDWFQGLNFDGKVNPKRQYMNEHRDITSLSRWESYKNVVKNIRNDEIILDNLSHSQWDDRYTYILSQRMSMRITALYYEGFEEYSIKQLDEYISSETDCYTSPLREAWGTKLLEAENRLSDARTTLDDYAEIEEFDYNYNSHRDYDYEKTKYKVTFSDGSEDNIEGDVLLNDERIERISISNLMERGGYKGKVLTYYKSPDNLNELMRLCFTLPYDEIDYYSELWKKAFGERFNDLLLNNSKSKAIDIISRECKIGKCIIMTYINGTRRQFLKRKAQMEAVCKYLVLTGKVIEKDSKRIMSAFTANQYLKSNGKTFKDMILALCQNENYSNGLLNRLLTYKYSNRKQLLDDLTRTKTIKTISII